MIAALANLAVFVVLIEARLTLAAMPVVLRSARYSRRESVFVVARRR